MEAVFEDVFCPLLNALLTHVISYARERKQKLVSEGTAFHTERTHPNLGFGS